MHRLDRIDLDLGTRLVPFLEGWEKQRAVHTAVAEGHRPATVLLVEHAPVYTVGRRTRSWERPQGLYVGPDRVPVVDVDRGGKTTWHGPGQLTVYPIIRLATPIDVIKYVRALEAAVMEVCALYGVDTMRIEGRSGVWVPPAPGAVGAARRDRKLCALGVRVARGTTMHGLALNVDPDLSAFGLDRIIPCGISDAGVTSLTEQTGVHYEAVDVATAMMEALERHLAPLMEQP
ncbi:lipoyl(octanoyl) transferase LipB [Actinomyces sp. MRS3W]|uniref:lipoyl(octanoyl) transferase LipB n=1 Tax=Actinomyces sp. MRS3W TaxID=2800796 RepID=UPI0028FD64EA|nr:lipoyl(octanoyl) transferase LipB [Actinomyces sp. MRS3W]MDU0348951.1 lipoyl(octanoyl) transferase LipB [Actinomyces sp. MRS3W]